MSHLSSSCVSVFETERKKGSPKVIQGPLCSNLCTTHKAFPVQRDAVHLAATRDVWSHSSNRNGVRSLSFMLCGQINLCLCQTYTHHLVPKYQIIPWWLVLVYFEKQYKCQLYSETEQRYTEYPSHKSQAEQDAKRQGHSFGDLLGSPHSQMRDSLPKEYAERQQNWISTSAEDSTHSPVRLLPRLSAPSACMHRASVLILVEADFLFFCSC